MADTIRVSHSFSCNCQSSFQRKEIDKSCLIAWCVNTPVWKAGLPMSIGPINDLRANSHQCVALRGRCEVIACSPRPFPTEAICEGLRPHVAMEATGVYWRPVWKARRLALMAVVRCLPQSTTY
jgi:hypothetical protein